MWRLEIIRNGKCIVTEWCVDGKHLHGVMTYYIGMNPNQDYMLYNPEDELVDGWL